ncbi:MAG: DUF4832 domain-containing protein [Pseudomonadota bacterium]
MNRKALFCVGFSVITMGFMEQSWAGRRTKATNPTIITTPIATDPASSLRQISYAENTTDIPNPERGIYHYPSNCDETPFDLATLQSYRSSEAKTVVICMFYLKNFKQSPISATALNFLQTQMNTVRQAGLKTILRFAYTEDMAGDDASPSQVSAHLDQLAPYIKNNKDVITVLEAGFIGAWGEWYYTKNFGDQGKMTTTDWANRKALVDKLLTILPSNRMVQLRYPLLKQNMYSGATALTSSTAFNGSSQARIGHHNDCFLAPWNDGGTYTNTSLDYPYLSADTTYTAMGGETCALNAPRSDCATALKELSLFHWSLLNGDYSADVVNSWKAQGCFDQIKRQLGYRFVLQSGTYPSSVQVLKTFSVNLTLKNSGWAAPFNPRAAEIILRNTSTSAVYRFPLTTNPRLWLPGQTITLNQSFTLPSSLQAGTYAMFLNLPDPEPTLSSKPEYSIRLANNSVWESTTGFNNLLSSLTVTP